MFSQIQSQSLVIKKADWPCRVCCMHACVIERRLQYSLVEVRACVIINIVVSQARLQQFNLVVVCSYNTAANPPASLASDRRILILGDSYSVGYGDAGESYPFLDLHLDRSHAQVNFNDKRNSKLSCVMSSLHNMLPQFWCEVLVQWAECLRHAMVYAVGRPIWIWYKILYEELRISFKTSITKLSEIFKCYSQVPQDEYCTQVLRFQIHARQTSGT